MIKSLDSTAVRIFTIFTLPANASMPDTANGNIHYHVIANASAILDCSCIFGLMVVIPAKIKTSMTVFESI